MVDTLTGRRGIEVVDSLEGTEDTDYGIELSKRRKRIDLAYVLRKSVTHCQHDATTSWALLG